MKFGKSLGVVVIAATSLGLGTVAMAQARTRSNPDPLYARNMKAIPVAQNSQQPKKQNKQQTFTGTIEKSQNGSYVLEEGGKNYRLDDSSLAAKYMGKEVKVTGVLDANTNTIHVTNIQPAM